ncbi:MAG: M55 family metallopeptidase [Victivallales bacterium]|nr:M55 family metallopeptidase [Victivallales bacterium]
MNIYIFADMEGISGVSGSDFVRLDGLFYQDGRRFYTMDINVCIDACFKAGADAVIVRDGHGSGNNLLWSELDPRAEVIQGNSGSTRLPGIKGCSAIILLGYHAMAGTTNALLEHTYSSTSIQNMWLNGERVGEFAIDSTIAAEYGIPTIMVSGDDKVCEEAKNWIPEIVTCQVKTGLTCQGARLLSRETAHKLIREKTIEAIESINRIKAPVINKPVKLKKEYVERHQIHIGNNVKMIDGHTIEITSNSLEEALLIG